jgi:enoyl-CoA hydratase/carnithine racemase
MNELFNYTTLDIKLSKPTRTLIIAFKKDYNVINLETLFELESILAWTSNRLEIHSILLTSHNEFFNEGMDKEKISQYDSKKILKISAKLQKIVHAMFHLPQTIICDLKSGSFDLGSELSLGADIRISNNDATIAFNHNRVGLTPSSGGIGFLNTLIGNSMARNWLLLGRKIPNAQLLNSGFIAQIYHESSDDIINDMLTSISHSAPVQRVQSKLGLLECVRNHFEDVIKFERSISLASVQSEDWKDQEHMPAKNMGTSVKMAKETLDQMEAENKH